MVLRAAGRQLPIVGIIRCAVVRNGSHLGSGRGSYSRVGCSCNLVNNTKTGYAFTTRLTQANKRQAKGMATPSSAPPPKPENVCLGCRKPVAKGSTSCAICAVDVSKGKMLEVARQGRIASKSLESRARVAATQRRQQTARWSWQPSSQPSWLTDEVHTNQIRPRLGSATLSQIASALGVSIPYASDIRKGRRRPHPRHWKVLAELVGLSADGH